MAKAANATTTYARNSGTRTGHPLYKTYKSMKQRCYLESSRWFPMYGGRGITVCDRWRDDFWAFVSDVGERPDGMSLDRVDNSKGYSPDNVRWATPHEQSCNTRRNTSHVGVIQQKKTGLWYARIMVNRQLHFGRYRKNLSDAVEDRKQLERQYLGREIAA